MKALKSYTLATIAEHIGATVDGDESCFLSGMNTLQAANFQQLSFLANPAYQRYLGDTDAGAVILHPDIAGLYQGNKLLSDNPYYSYALCSELFASASSLQSNTIHPSAVMGESCVLGDNVSIAPNVVIGSDVVIGENVIVGAGVFIGDNVLIGDGSIVHPNVSIYADCTIGANAIVHSQVVIGSDGFGFAPKRGEAGWQKIYQLGGVRIGDDVEIGASTTIDRGALGDTIIGNGVKLDNQIQVAHNVEIGAYTAIAGATAVAGSTTIGKRCTIAGAVGIIGHLSITDDVHITAMTLVTKSINESGSYSSGTPLNRTSLWKKNAARFNQLDTVIKKINKKIK